jgi:hypothetical protein
MDFQPGNVYYDRMSFHKDRNSFRRHFPDHPPRESRPHEHRPPEQWQDEQELGETPDPTSTGSEATYFRSLIDSNTLVTVVLVTGERLRGHVRYYDRDCFSLGPDGGGANVFLRKDSVRCISEE